MSWTDALARYDKDHDAKIAQTEIAGDTPMDKMLSPKCGFPAFDLAARHPRRQEWDVFRAMAGSEKRPARDQTGRRG